MKENMAGMHHRIFFSSNEDFKEKTEKENQYAVALCYLKKEPDMFSGSRNAGLDHCTAL